MKIIWHGHSCFTLETEDGTVVFDPYAPGSIPGLELPPLSADEVICSHDHRDHNAVECVKLTRRAVGYGKKQISVFHDDDRGRKRGENLITVIESEGLRVVHLGDLGHELDARQLEEVGKPDVLLVPVGGFYTIDPETAEKVSRALDAALIIPMHYRIEESGFDVISTVDEFTKLFDNVRYEQSNTLEISGKPEREVVVLKI